MLVAFSVHSLLEGLVIGVQSTPTEVMLLVGAVSCHKLVVAFCLGAELSSDGRPLYSVIPPIFVYVLGSALGILAGMFLHLGTNPEGNMVVPVFQAIAGGTLLYIVLSEILPRERSKSLPGYAPFVQFLLFIIGFVLMVLLNFYV
ncbi:hypothetical protein AAG570_004108 [Ranatra chinensis]|uniref:Uncharacterized protein n=1 Tax=Ranatra chinensis TaxID=642074 RepID=A0ABD0YHB9_9HEMI